jgi:OOP family OmpA-OmpF porin
LRRAQSVADRLARFGVERSRLTTVGYGAEQPLAPGDTPAARAENRRVEFAVR